MFLEAQNDALVSLVLASVAMWRPALQTLRSCLENVLGACYYADHPVESKLWEMGQHRIGFASLIDYFARHPVSFELPGVPRPLQGLSSEYSTLSRAVHASARSFHMTRAGSIRITNSDDVEFNQWESRHRATLLWLNVFLLMLYSDQVSGGLRRPLRKAVSLTVPRNYHKAIKRELSVHLFSV